MKYLTKLHKSLFLLIKIIKINVELSEILILIVTH